MECNYISVNKNSAINSYGEMLSVGDKVTHQDTEVGTATITGFRIDEAQEEVVAITDKGEAHIDFVIKLRELPEPEPK